MEFGIAVVVAVTGRRTPPGTLLPGAQAPALTPHGALPGRACWTNNTFSKVPVRKNTVLKHQLLIHLQVTQLPEKDISLLLEAREDSNLRGGLADPTPSPKPIANQ